MIHDYERLESGEKGQAAAGEGAEEDGAGADDATASVGVNPVVADTKNTGGKMLAARGKQKTAGNTRAAGGRPSHEALQGRQEADPLMRPYKGSRRQTLL